MARMIPKWIDDGAPASERRVFEKLERDPAARNWTVLHSLGLSRRRTGPYGEIDFVVIIPDEGVVCLEVKGGGVSCQNGIWQTRNRYGEVNQIKKSPFMQAKENLFALRDAIRKHFGESAAESQCLTGYAVVFPDVACPPLPLPPEVDRAEVIDHNDLSKSISDAVMRCARYASRIHSPRGRGGATGPAPRNVKNILKFLRPDFEVVVTPQARMGLIVEDLLRLTEEQYNRLDELEDNDRCLLTGAAGTGKTMLAMEYAKREARKGSRVLLTCFNALLGGWIRREFRDTIEVTAGNWHQIAGNFARRSSFKDEFEKKDNEIKKSGVDDRNKLGFDELYAYYGQLGLEEHDVLFDVLVVDEAQDLLWSPHVREFLDAALRGGLAGARWAIFGDFNRQAIRPNVEPFDPDTVLADYRFAKCRLSWNCRNSRAIAEATEVVTGVESRIPKSDSMISELKVEHHYYRKSGFVTLLTEKVERLTAGGTAVEDIVVLSPYRLDNPEKSGLAGIERIAGHPLADAEPGAEVVPRSIRVATISRFKGLERNVVILVNVDAMDEAGKESLLYVGMTRARALLILLITDTKQARAVWEPRFQEIARRTAGGPVEAA